MLFILTGGVQTGKTRWLMGLADDLSRSGVVCSGVIAPGDWVGDGVGGYEKLGIDNLLLPERRLIPFARRRDLALAEGSYDENSESARAGLKWEISGDALAEVNAHFDRLASGECEGGTFGYAEAPELLIIDELGQLELKSGQGLASALALVDAGSPPSCACEGAGKHCLVVVRENLLKLASERFVDKWRGISVIAPDGSSKHKIMETLLS